MVEQWITKSKFIARNLHSRGYERTPLIQRKLTRYCVWHLLTKVLQMMHEMRYQSEWSNEKNEMYKRLKTIIYRWQRPWGNHMLFRRSLCVLFCECVFSSFFSNHPSLFVSFTQPCYGWICTVFFLCSRLSPTMQCAVVSSGLRTRTGELFPFYQYVDCMKCEKVCMCVCVSLCSSNSVIPYLDAWSRYPCWYVECQNIF